VAPEASRSRLHWAAMSAHRRAATTWPLRDEQQTPGSISLGAGGMHRESARTARSVITSAAGNAA
jgi:hypothetical protein